MRGLGAVGWWCATSLALSCSVSALTVRVDPAGGAPRLVVDGAPVRARMFWGAPGSSVLPVQAAWQRVEFEFVAAADAQNGTIHFRFGNQPGEVCLDDIQVTDLDAKRDVIASCDFEGGANSLGPTWRVWPPGEQNTVGTVTVAPGAGHEGSAGLRIQLKAPAKAKWPDFHVYHQDTLQIAKGHRLRVSFWAKAQPARNLTVAVYRPGQNYLSLGSAPGCFESQIKLAAAAGVDPVSFPCPLPWPKPGAAPDWTGADLVCEKVLHANPKALLLPRIGMTPPPWWREAHPEDVMLWENGSVSNSAVVASARYRREAAEQLGALVRHLEEKFGDHVAGYHPTGQNTGEWFYQAAWHKTLSGYAPADLAAWRAWLKQRYGNDAALQSAWKESGVSLATVAVPTAAERHAAPAGIFRDPVAERHLIDWGEFQQEAMADCVIELAQAARKASQGRKLVVFFYGYLFEFGGVPTGPAVSGHYALRRVLNCPDIDVVCSPISYFDRGLGQSAPAMTAAESVALAGKLWLNEDDTHTYLATGTPPGARDHVTSLAESNHELVRNVAQEALRNFGTWWMDLGATGWFNDAGMWAEMARLKALDEPLLRQPTPFRPEVAAVMDERSMLRVAEGGAKATRPGIYEVRQPLGRLGAPYGQYLLDDVLGGKVKAKLYVMLSTWCLSGAERAKLLQATRGSTRVWCYAPGYFEDYRVSPEGMRQATGFDLKPVTADKAWATPTEAGRKLGLTQAFGVQGPITPLFAAADAKPEEVLATYPDGSAAVALRRSGEGASLFVGVPGLTSELLRAASREAGVHLFTQRDCNVYASGPFVALHAAETGTLELNTGKAGEVTDVLTGQPAGRGPSLQLPLKRGETRVLKY